jgi:DNA repair protein RecO (recombination protein O)
LNPRAFKTDALVLHSRPLGEADRLITLLTWERGKLAAVARGARKIKSKLAAGVDLFTFGHYQLHQGRSLAIITGQDVKEHFIRFREDPSLYPYGLYLAALADRLIAGTEPCPGSCRLLLDAWRLICAAGDRDLLCRAFELQLMDLAGYRPHLRDCLACGAADAACFSPRQGGVLCSRCAGGDGFALDPGTVALAARLIENPLEQFRLLRPGPRQAHELARLTTAFLRYHHSIDLAPGDKIPL